MENTERNLKEGRTQVPQPSAAMNTGTAFAPQREPMCAQHCAQRGTRMGLGEAAQETNHPR